MRTNEQSAKRHWTLDDIPWDQFDASKVDPDILRIVKAAALVEYNGADYADYLCGVFHDDADFQAETRRWSEEEVQHGKALARWATLADPTFDLDEAQKKFHAGFKVDVNATESVRGSRAGELIARCMVETGTSSYYTCMRGKTEEPVLREICRNIAADELRHWKLFYKTLQKYQQEENLSLVRRMAVAFGRIKETDDDELSYAFYAANDDIDEPYDRKACYRAYSRRVARFYDKPTLERAMAMTFKAIGLKPHSRLNLMVAKVAAWHARRLAQKPELIDSIAA